MNNAQLFAEGGNAINWVKKGSYRINGYDKAGDLIYTLKNKWALGWWYLDNVWEGHEVGQFDNPSLNAYAKAEEDYKTIYGEEEEESILGQHAYVHNYNG